jgi:hypothetical protein
VAYKLMALPQDHEFYADLRALLGDGRVDGIWSTASVLYENYSTVEELMFLAYSLCVLADAVVEAEAG